MYIHTFLAYPLVSDDFLLHESTVVIIDVLRASTTICHALCNGAREVIPVSELEHAVRLSRSMSRETTLLGGERKGVKPSGFDLGNSPLEYTGDAVERRNIILTTTNGTQVLARTKYAQRQLVGSFVNLSAIADYLLSPPNAEQTEKVFLVCAGNNGDFAFEDMLFAGALAERLAGRTTAELSDATRVAAAMFGTNRESLSGAIHSAQHAQYLASIGFAADIDAAIAIDSCPVVPVLQGNSFKAT